MRKIRRSDSDLDKNPYTNGKFEKPMDNTKTSPKRLLDNDWGPT